MTGRNLTPVNARLFADGKDILPPLGENFLMRALPAAVSDDALYNALNAAAAAPAVRARFACGLTPGDRVEYDVRTSYIASRQECAIAQRLLAIQRVVTAGRGRTLADILRVHALAMRLRGVHALDLAVASSVSLPRMSAFVCAPITAEIHKLLFALRAYAGSHIEHTSVATEIGNVTREVPAHIYQVPFLLVEMPSRVSFETFVPAVCAAVDDLLGADTLAYTGAHATGSHGQLLLRLMTALNVGVLILHGLSSSHVASEKRESRLDDVWSTLLKIRNLGVGVVAFATPAVWMAPRSSVFAELFPEPAFEITAMTRQDAREAFVPTWNLLKGLGAPGEQDFLRLVERCFGQRQWIGNALLQCYRDAMSGSGQAMRNILASAQDVNARGSQAIPFQLWQNYAKSRPLNPQQVSDHRDWLMLDMQIHC